MLWPKTGITHYHEQLGLPDKGSAIKGLVVCSVVELIGSGWNESVDKRKVHGSGPSL